MADEQDRTEEQNGTDENGDGENSGGTRSKRILTDINRRFPEIHTRARVMGSDENVSLRVSLFGEHADEHELDAVLGRAEADLRAGSTGAADILDRLFQCLQEA